MSDTNGNGNNGPFEQEPIDNTGALTGMDDAAPLLPSSSSTLPGNSSGNPAVIPELPDASMNAEENQRSTQKSSEVEDDSRMPPSNAPEFPPSQPENPNQNPSQAISRKRSAPETKSDSGSEADGDDESSTGPTGAKQPNVTSGSPNQSNPESGSSSTPTGNIKSKPKRPPQVTIKLSTQKAYTIPPIDKLNENVATTGNYVVRNLTIGHEDFGAAQFLGFRDLRSLEQEGEIDLCRYVKFYKVGCVCVGDSAITQAVLLGPGPMLVTLPKVTKEVFAEQAKKLGNPEGEPVSDQLLEIILRKGLQTMDDPSFVQLNEQAETLVFMMQRGREMEPESGNGGDNNNED